jgi:hypothetical protein
MAKVVQQYKEWHREIYCEFCELSGHSEQGSSETTVTDLRFRQQGVNLPRKEYLTPCLLPTVCV